MHRYLKTIFAAVSIFGAAFMLFYAIRLINKNTPREKKVEVKMLPPTAPVKSRSEDPRAAAGYIGGVGLVEPVGEATVIGSQLAGVVEKVFVVPGNSVQQGQELLQLDTRSALADVGVAQAELNAQQAKLVELQTQIDVMRARVDAAVSIQDQAAAAEANAKRDLDRASTIGVANALSQEEMDTRRMNWDTAKAKYREAQARVREAQANLSLLDGKPIAASIEVQKAAVAEAVASLARAQTNLDLRTIRAPKPGTILSVKIRVGEFVPASVLASPLITMGQIEPLHIRVDIDESEIPRLRPEAIATATLRGSSGKGVPLQYVRTEPLVIPKRNLTGTVAERVDTRVMQVIYSVSPSVLHATVGQQVDVYIEDKSNNAATK
ncbi:MAG: efflux RND transporter periplasmic adaptor subunit [Planctomycetes bacterium]|nr:efflux RND transporter periplasmic adaptor subunit [Planctomycetota bacterium]